MALGLVILTSAPKRGKDLQVKFICLYFICLDEIPEFVGDVGVQIINKDNQENA